MRNLIILLVLSACGSTQISQGLQWQRDALTVAKKNRERVINTLFDEIELAYGKQIDERLAALTTKDPSQSEKLILQAQAQKDKIHDVLAAKREEILKDEAFDLVVRLNAAMLPLAQAKAEQASMVSGLIGEANSKKIEGYIQRIPDLDILGN